MYKPYTYPKKQEKKDGYTANLTVVNTLANDSWRLAVNLATNTVGGTKNLSDRTLEFPGKGLIVYSASNLNNLVKMDGLGVLDVFLLSAVA